jgi:hypothetical protein
MTKPEERTRAVTETRLFLETLHGSQDEIMWGLVRSVALQLLRHYPLDLDLAASAEALPEIWAAPPSEQAHCLCRCTGDG